MRELQGKTAIVTGASRGIGAHIARALARQGMNVALVARDAAALESVSYELLELGGRALVVPADLEDLAEHEALQERVTRELGPVDVLVNNAAIDAPIPFHEEARELTQRMLHLDLLVPMLLTRRLLPDMLARRSGHVVNIASLAGKAAAPYWASYAAAKGGLIAFTHSLRAELRGSGVSASAVSPGFVTDAGMFAERKRTHDLRVPVAVGSYSAAQVADAVVRAVREDCAEILASPGPTRLMQMFNQLAPDAYVWLLQRVGAADLLRGMARLPETGTPAQRRAS